LLKASDIFKAPTPNAETIPVTTAVTGPTGVGKSSFIQRVAGVQGIKISHDLCPGMLSIGWHVLLHPLSDLHAFGVLHFSVRRASHSFSELRSMSRVLISTTPIMTRENVYSNDDIR
jgi:hypothetical protein